MKFTILRSKFLEGLTTVQNVVSAKGTLQILSNALIHVEDNQMCITTTDLDISMRCTIPCQVEESGSTTLPVRLLADTIKKAKEGNVQIEVNNNDRASVLSGSNNSKIEGLSTRDFPPVPSAEGKHCFRIDQGVLKAMFRKTSYAASLDETRRVLNGVLLAFKENKLTMVATDGRRLALVDHEIEVSPEAETEMILPTKAVAELVRMLGNEGEVKIYAQKNLAVFESGTTVMSSKLVDGVYPNYRQVIPGGCDERVSIDREELLEAVGRVSVVATDKSNAVRMTFSANQLMLYLNSQGVGESYETIAVKYSGREISIVFNPEYVMDPLKNMEDDEVYFELNDGHSPALLKCKVPFLYVLMPLRIS